MLTLLRHAYSTRLKSSKHVGMLAQDRRGREVDEVRERERERKRERERARQEKIKTGREDLEGNTKRYIDRRRKRERERQREREADSKRER